MVTIFLTRFDKPLTEKQYNEYKSLLSDDLQKKNAKYMFWQDRHAHLFGKLLFIEALKSIGIKENFWSYLRYNTYQRPCLNINGYDINVSHSGYYVICGISREKRVGIDIEKIKSIKLNNFRNVMSPSQWERINNSENRLQEFYRYWTIKESVVKADGQGMYFPFDKLHIIDSTVNCNQKTWYINEIEIDTSYKLALATDKQSDFKIERKNYY